MLSSPNVFMRPRESAKAADEAKARFSHVDGQPPPLPPLGAIFALQIVQAEVFPHKDHASQASMALLDPCDRNRLCLLDAVLWMYPTLAYAHTFLPRCFFRSRNAKFALVELHSAGCLVELSPPTTESHS